MSVQEGKLKNGNISITEFSKRINLKRSFVIDYMIKNKYIYKQPYGEDKERVKNIAFPKYDTEKGIGLFEMNKRKNKFNRGKDNVNIQLTPKGQEYFLKEFREKGVL